MLCNERHMYEPIVAQSIANGVSSAWNHRAVQMVIEDIFLIRASAVIASRAAAALPPPGLTNAGITPAGMVPAGISPAVVRAPALTPAPAR